MMNTDRTINYASGAKSWNRNEIQHYGLGRLDFTPFTKLQANASWVWSPAKRNGALPNRDIRVAAPSNDQAILGGYVPSQSLTWSVNYTATPKLIISARYGYKYFNSKDGNYGIVASPYITYNTAAPNDPAVPAIWQQGTGYRNVSSTLAIVKDVMTRHNLYLDGTYIVNLGGQQHTLKGGWMMNKGFEDYVDDYTNGQFTVNWGDSFTRNTIVGAKGAYGYYTWEDGTRHNNHARGKNQGMYIQDAWRVNHRLSINVGVRLENEFLPPYSQEFRVALAPHFVFQAVEGMNRILLHVVTDPG